MEQIGHITTENYKFSEAFTFVKTTENTKIFSHFYTRTHRLSFEYCLFIATVPSVLTDAEIESLNEKLKDIIRLDGAWHTSQIAKNFVGEVSRKKFPDAKQQKLDEMKAELPPGVEYEIHLAKCYKNYSPKDFRYNLNITRNKEMNQIMLINRTLLNNNPLFKN